MNKKVIYLILGGVAILVMLMIIIAGQVRIKFLETQMAQLERELSFFQKLDSSKVVVDKIVSARGTIEKIEGNELILRADGETLTFLLNEDTIVEEVVLTEPNQPVKTKTLERKDLKTGQDVHVSAKLEFGRLKVDRIVVLPSL